MILKKQQIPTVPPHIYAVRIQTTKVTAFFFSTL